jgi:anti-sigma factor RsiW
MNEHEIIRQWLALAAAGALEAREQERLDRHLRDCPACAAELDEWQFLTGGLRRLPTPQPPAALVEKTRARCEWQFAAAAEETWNRGVLIFLVLFAWTLTLASWPLVRLATGGLLSWVDPQFSHTWLAMLVYTSLAWVAGGAAAAMLGLRKRHERSLA